MDARPDRMRRAGWWMLAVAAMAVTASPSQAFYWVGWPGVGSPQPPKIISEQVKVEHRDPNPQGTNPPGGLPYRPPGGGDDEPPPPGGVPEPGTLVLAGLGLAAMFGAKRAIRRK